MYIYASYLLNIIIWRGSPYLSLFVFNETLFTENDYSN